MHFRRTRKKVSEESAVVDPTTVRLSEHFLLSDLIGCHSVYTKGYANLFDDPDGSKLAEGECLAQTVLEPIVADSPISVSYGYISLDLARQIVKYQSPEKPSYHQWNAGAACDLIVHELDRQDVAPIWIARAIDEEFPTSRTITYAESSYICVATRRNEVEENKPRRAFYENRFKGTGVKPQFLEVWKDREAYFKNIKTSFPWRGQGYPSYHGGGRRQVHHIRVGRYAMLSDFLYSTRAVTEGLKNCPTLCDNWLVKFEHVGRIYSDILKAIGCNRLSIVRAFESPSWSSDSRHHWVDEFRLEMVPPASMPIHEVTAKVVRAGFGIEGMVGVGCMPAKRIMVVSGVFPK